MHGRLTRGGYHGNISRYTVHFLLILIYAHEIFLLPIGKRNMPESYIDTMKQSKKKKKFSRISELFSSKLIAWQPNRRICMVGSCAIAFYITLKLFRRSNNIR